MEDVYLSSYIYSYCKEQQRNGHNIVVSSPEHGKTSIKIGEQDFEFSMSRSPFNSEHAIAFCNDKTHAPTNTVSSLPLPFTEAYPKNRSPFKEIMEKINSESHPFYFPLVIKPNEGTMSHSVFIARNSQELETALDHNAKDPENGNSVLIQQCIEGAKEYRAICFKGECVFAYEKNGYLSGECVNPIYQPNGVAIATEDETILSAINEIAKTLKNRHDVTYTGLDILIDSNGNATLIDINPAPCGLRKVVIDCGDKPIRKLCHAMTEHMKFMAQPVMDFSQQNVLSA